MYLLLVDRTACPRCGPDFGLILLADRLDDRRVREGSLGCSNCRERYPIRDGVADLRPPPRASLSEGDGALARPSHDGQDERRALVAAAASGIGPDGGTLLLADAASSLAGAIAAVSPPGTEVVTAERGRPTGPDGTGISRTVVGPTLPFVSETFSGVVLVGAGATTEAIREAARVLRRGHRVVVLEPPPDVRTRLGASGLLRFTQGEGVVAAGR